MQASPRPVGMPAVASTPCMPPAPEMVARRQFSSPWYDPSMTTKIAVSLPDELVDAARRAVAEGRSNSVSAFIAAAIADKARFDDLEALLADMAAESGPPHEADRRWARQALGLA